MNIGNSFRFSSYVKSAAYNQHTSKYLYIKEDGLDIFTSSWYSGGLLNDNRHDFETVLFLGKGDHCYNGVFQECLKQIELLR